MTTRSTKTLAFTQKLIALFGLLLCLNTNANAQLIWGASPFQDSLWSVDTTTYTVVNRIGPTLAGATITGMTGLAFDPVGHETYILMKLSGVTARALGKINLQTGVCTLIDTLSTKFASINFRADGQLFGVTGNGGTPSETLFLIDKATGAETFAVTLGNGADGEIICYNHDDDFFYHWSGNSTVVFEKFLPFAPYTVTAISSSTNETFGALYIGHNAFLSSNINSAFRHFTSTGSFGADFASLPDDLRGLVMPPVFTPDNDSICANVEPLGIDFKGIAYDTVMYAWGDGTVDVVFPAASASHAYTTTGNKTVRVILDSKFSSTLDTFMTFVVNVRNSPTVALNPGPSALSCDGDSITFTGTSGGSSQWYFNGSPVLGANTNSYSDNTPGVYNMVKTNLNGCADSSHVSTILVGGTTPPPFSLGADTSLCDSALFCLGDTAMPGMLYAWSNGDTLPSTCFSGPGQFILSISDSAGCTISDTLVGSAVAPLAAFSLGADTLSCDSALICLGGTPTAGLTYLWSNGATTSSICVNAAAVYTLEVADAFGCDAVSDTILLSTNSTPNPEIIEDGTLCPEYSFSVLDGPNEVWAWDFGDGSGNPSGTATITHTYNANGTYVVTVNRTNECGTGTDSITVVIQCLFSIENSIQGSIVAYPNPAHDQLHLQLALDEPMEVTYEILDLSGRAVLSGAFDGLVQNADQVISMPLPAGVYILRAHANEGTANFRIIKE